MTYTYAATITIQVRDTDGECGSITRRIKREEWRSPNGIASPLLIAELLTSIGAADLSPGPDTTAQAELAAFSGGEPG